MERLLNTIKKIWVFLCWKEGQPSKTAFFVSTATLIALFLWFVQEMFHGLVIKGFTIPEFDFISATAMLTTIATLYLVNHKVKQKISASGVESELNGDK